MSVGEDKTEFPSPVVQRVRQSLRVIGSARATAAMPINRYLSGFISVEQPWMLLSSAGPKEWGAGLITPYLAENSTPLEHVSEEFDLNED